MHIDRLTKNLSLDFWGLGRQARHAEQRPCQDTQRHKALGPTAEAAVSQRFIGRGHDTIMESSMFGRGT